MFENNLVPLTRAKLCKQLWAIDHIRRDTEVARMQCDSCIGKLNFINIRQGKTFIEFVVDRWQSKLDGLFEEDVKELRSDTTNGADFNVCRWKHIFHLTNDLFVHDLDTGAGFKGHVNHQSR